MKLLTSVFLRVSVGSFFFAESLNLKMVLYLCMNR